MKPLKFPAALAAFAMLSLASVPADAAPWDMPIREIPMSGLDDIAKASYDALGPVIYYNPTTVAQVPTKVATFVRAHEYAHHTLSHLTRSTNAVTPWGHAKVRQDWEKEADCLAAQVVDADVAEAAAEFFEKKIGAVQVDWFHPTGYDRAVHIRKCSGTAGAAGAKKSVATKALHRDVRKLMEDALKSFTATKGSQTKQDKTKYMVSTTYAATSSLLGGDCDVLENDGKYGTSTTYMCVIDFTDVTDARDAYDALRELVIKYMPDDNNEVIDTVSKKGKQFKAKNESKGLSQELEIGKLKGGPYFVSFDLGYEKKKSP